MSDQTVAPTVRPKKKPPTVQDGPSSGFKRTKRWVDLTFGYGGQVPLVSGTPIPTPSAAAGPTGTVVNGVPTDIGEPQDFDENFPVPRPDVPELSEGIQPEIYDNSVLGGFVKFMDRIVPDDLGGMIRGESGWLSNVPLYEETLGKVAGAPLEAGAVAIDALNWGADQMNHLGAALVSWLPGGIQTLDWEQSQDVSFGQAFVASMGATAGRLERGQAEGGDWLMLPFSLISLGAAQLDPDNIAQDPNFSVLNEEQMQQAFGSGAGMWATGGLDAAWLVGADPAILLGGASMIARTGAKGTKFGGLTNQALRKVEQVDSIAADLSKDAALIAELGIDGARSSGRLGSEGENLIAAMQGNATDLTTHIWATGENASRAKSIITFLSETSVDEPQKAADLVSALMGHAPSWRRLKDVWKDHDLYDRLSLSNGVDNLTPVRTLDADARAIENGGIYDITPAQARYGDELFEQAENATNDAQVISDKFLAFEEEFGTGFTYAADEVVESGAVAADQFAGQMITRGGAQIAPGMVRAANAWRRGKARSQFGTAKRPVQAGQVSERGHFVYDFIEKTSSSRPMTVVRWLGQGTPNGIVFLKGGDGERGVREVSNWLRKSPLDPDTATLFLNRFVGETTEAGRALILREMEEAAVRQIAAKHNISAENATQLFGRYDAKRKASLANARKTKTKFYVDPDTGEAVKLPSFYAEIDAAVPMLDTKLFDKVVGKNKIALSATDVSNALDALNTVWKVSVLLRLGYTQRNVVEGFMRSAAVIGLAATNPKALGNLPVNIYHYAGMKRGLRSARKVEADLSRARANLADARLMIAKSTTKKGKAKKGQQQVLTDAQKREADELARIDELSDQLDSAIQIVKQRNAKRKKTGVGANQVAPGVYLAGAFDGSEGEIARLISSADRTTRNAIQSSAQRRIDELGDSQDFVIIDPTQLTDAKQFENYYATFTERVNRRYISDPVGAMILADMPIARIKAWFRTPEGRAYWDQLQATGGATPAWQDVDTYLSKVIDRINYELPQGSKIRELAVKGDRLLQGEVASALRGTDLPIIPGRMADESGATMVGLARRGFKFGLEEAMKWLGTIPETNLLRHPFYNSIYKSRQKELYELAARQGQDMGSATVKAKINKSAHADALRATNDTMYTIQELSNAATMLRWISPFFPAWENSIRTWGRLVYNNPALLGAGNILWNIPNNLGWVVNENGEKVENSNFLREDNNFIVWPEFIADVLRKDFGPFTPGESIMTRQQGFNVIFPGGEWWFPGVGPMTQIPTALALRGKPEDQEIIKQAIGENLYRQIVPNGNPNVDLVEAILPTVGRRLKQMRSGESSDSAYLTLKNTMIEDAYITAQLEGRALTEKDYRMIDKKVNQFWTFQVIAAVTAFTSASSYNSPYKLQRDEWNRLIDDQSLTYREKIDRFMDKFGGSDAYLAITRSASQTETGLQPNLKTWNRITKNPDFVKRLNTIDPKLVGMFGNMGSFDDPFSYAVYGEYSGTSIDGKTPIRSQMTPRQLAAKNEIADGWREWNLIKDAAENKAIELGYSSLQVDEAQNLRDMLTEAEAELTAKYPAWGTEKEAYSAEWPKFIQGSRLLVENAELVDEDSTIYALNQYLIIREAIVDKLRSTKNDEARKNIKQLGYAAAFELRQTDIGFADFYDQYLASDDFREI